MKLHFMKDDALAYFKQNVEYNCKNYLSKDNNWVFDKFADGSPLIEFKFEVPDFKMDMSSKNVGDTDYNNVKILYPALKDVSDTQASDERFWTGLSHGVLWSYMQYRCQLSDENISPNKIMTNYFFNYGNKRSLIVHPIARLWWVGRLIYDEKATDHFKALEYLKVDFPTKVLTLFSSNYTNNPKITRALLLAVAEIEQKGNKVKRNDYHELIRYVNSLGGIIILDYLSEDELKDKIKKHYYEVHKN